MRNFESGYKLHEQLEENFLARYFGPHRKIQNFARELILDKKKILAKILNLDINFLGADINPNEFIRKFKEKEIYISAFPNGRVQKKTFDTGWHTSGQPNYDINKLAWESKIFIRVILGIFILNLIIIPFMW